MGRDRGDLFLDVAVEFGPDRIGRVAGIDEAGEGGEPAEQVLQCLVADDRLGELGCRGLARGDRGKASLERGLEGDRLALGLVEVAPDGGRIHGGIERAQVPLRQHAESAGSLDTRSLDTRSLGALARAFCSGCLERSAHGWSLRRDEQKRPVWSEPAARSMRRFARHGRNIGGVARRQRSVAARNRQPAARWRGSAAIPAPDLRKRTSE